MKKSEMQCWYTSALDEEISMMVNFKNSDIAGLENKKPVVYEFVPEKL